MCAKFTGYYYDASGAKLLQSWSLEVNYQRTDTATTAEIDISSMSITNFKGYISIAGTKYDNINSLDATTTINVNKRITVEKKTTEADYVINIFLHSSSVYRMSSNKSYSTDRTITVHTTALKQYYVNYYKGDAPNASGIPGSQTKIEGVSLTLSSNTPTSDYGTFRNWNTSSSGTGTSYSPGSTYNNDASLSLYAIWQVKTYTVSYNANGGSGAPDRQTKIHGQSLTLSSSRPVKNNHTFDSWRTSADGTGNRYLPGGTYSSNEDVTLYAVWTPDTYTIQYYANGGSGAPSSQTKTADVALTLSNSTPSRTGYTFKQWNTNEDGYGTTYRPGASYTRNESLDLYAIWDPIPYYITYDANGGSSAPSRQTKYYGEVIYISDTIPRRTGYDFLYWRDGLYSGTRWDPGESYSGNYDLTLYAIWQIITYTVSYSSNGGSGAPSLQTKNYGENLTLSSSIPYWTGHTFKSWNTNSDGSGSNYQPGGSYTRNESITLYAKWELEKYTISFDADGGTGAPSAKTKYYSEALIIPDTIPRRTGYEFLSWSSYSVYYFPGDIYTREGDATLYARWSKIYYTITYDANGGTNAPVEQSKGYGDSIILTNNTPTKQYYTFKVWNTNSSGTGTNYQPGSEYTRNEALTLYAIWTPNTYTVSYNPNGGSGAPDAQTKTADIDLRLSNNRPVRSGFTFTFWSTSADGRTGTSYDPGDTYTGNANLVLYAIWLPGVFYDANGGSGAPSTQVIFDTSPITLSDAIPVRDNHTFLYWNTSRDGTGTRYNPGGTLTPANNKDNIFLYAIWRRDPDRPTVSAMLVTRRNVNGVLDDEGTYMHISVTWNVDTVRRSGNTGQCKLYYKLSSSPTWINVFTSAYAESATSTKLVSNISTDEQYDVKAVITDADSRVTERVDVLTRAKFVWDIAVGGEAMGIGSAAPSNGFEVGWVTQLDEDVTMLKNLLVVGSIVTNQAISAPNFNISSTSDGIITSSSYWTVSGQVAYFFGPICSINITLAPSRTYQIGEVNEMIATIGEAFRPIVGHSFGTYWGLGYITTQGQIHFQNYQVISDSNQLQIGLTYIRQIS